MMQPIRHLFKAVLMIGLLIPGAAWATQSGPKVPMKPVFELKDGQVLAQYTPKAKNSSIQVRFTVSPGKLTEVSPKDFEGAKRSDIDHKDFKSGLFRIEAQGVPKGEEAKFSLTSDFFTSSTEFWVFNAKAATPWTNGNAVSKTVEGLTSTLEIKVVDGGPLDADGKADGSILLIGGPRDSFWGYALGTLFIRFFGIFIVLTILMLGMMASGRIFQYYDEKKDTTPASVPPPDETHSKEVEAAADPISVPAGVSPDIAAAIAMTLAMHFGARDQTPRPALTAPQPTTWTHHGRETMMRKRFIHIHR